MIKLDRQSNLYIFLYSSVMVILVAALLSIASTALRGPQQRNIETERRLDILRSVGRAQLAADARDRHAYVAQEFEEVIVRQLAVNHRGEPLEGLDVFAIDLRAELAKPMEEQRLPIFVAQLEDGSLKYVLPLRGRGLWGPIWGYLALNDDMNTIYGASFAHRSETPGLGAEISTAGFQAQFRGERIFRNGELVSVAVVKGGAAPNDPHAVDALSGGTITCQGLEDMLLSNLRGYEQFLLRNAPSPAPAPQPEVQPIEPPASQPIHRPVAQPIQRPTQQPALQSAEQPVEQPVEQPIEQPTEQLTPVDQALPSP